MLCVSFILLVVLYALVPFSGKKITNLTNKVCFLSTNASYGMSQTNFLPKGWSISKRSTVWENAKYIKYPSPMALTMPYVYTCKWICIVPLLSQIFQKLGANQRSYHGRLQHLERCRAGGESPLWANNCRDKERFSLRWHPSYPPTKQVKPQASSKLHQRHAPTSPGIVGRAQETVGKMDGPFSRCSSTASVYQMMIAIDGNFFRILCLNLQKVIQ